MTEARETLLNRNIVHITMAGFALLIGRVPPWAIVLLCFLALVFNVIILPRITKRSLEKPEDQDRGYSVGLLTYPSVLLLISILFYHHQVFLAVGWGMMAFGDGFASIVGRRIGRVKWYGGPKTLEGSIAFFFAATLLSMGMLYLLPAQVTSVLSWNEWWVVVPVVALFAAATEVTPGFFDDNLSVPLTGSLFSFAFYMMIREGILEWPAPGWDGPLVVLVFGILSFGSKAIDLKGALAGMIIALSIWLGGGFPALLLLFLFFAIGSVAGFMGRQKKLDTGREDFRSTKRGWRNAVANAGAASLAGILAWTLPTDNSIFLAALAGSLASAASDTLSSELGTPFGRRFLDLRTMKFTVPGDDGVISLTGILAGTAGALLIGLASWLLVGDMAFVVAVFLAGFSGNILDSMLGAGLQRGGFMNNHSVNLSSTLLAALIAAVLYMAF